MAELINRLKIDKFTSEELMYLSSNYELEMQVFQNQEEKRSFEERETKLQLELKAEREKREVEVKAEREKRDVEVKAEREKREVEVNAEREKREVEVNAEREKHHADLLKGIRKLLNRGETIEAIADFFELPVEEITAFVKEIEDKDRENTYRSS